MHAVEEDLKDVAWAAKKLNLSVFTIYAKVRAGQIPCVRIGKSIKFRPSEVEAMIIAQSQPIAA